MRGPGLTLDTARSGRGLVPNLEPVTALACVRLTLSARRGSAGKGVLDSRVGRSHIVPSRFDLACQSFVCVVFLDRVPCGAIQSLRLMGVEQ